MSSTLARIAAFWLVLALLFGAGARFLMGQADQVDEGALLYYEQPVWSEDESQIAFMRYESAHPPTLEERARLPRSLFRVSRIDETPLKIADLGTERYRLLGWLDKDQSLLLQPLKAEGPPRVLVVSIFGKQQEIRFEKDGLSLVGVQGGQLFFQRITRNGRYEVPQIVREEEGAATPSPTPQPSQTPPPGLTRDEVALLAWTPGDNSLTRLVGIPTEGEEIAIHAAYPSPDGKWVAVVLKVGSDLALWMLQREENRFLWTSIKVPTAQMHVAWAPDSTGLVAAVDSALFAIWNMQTMEYTKIRSQQAKTYRVFWPRGEKFFLLLDESGIYHFDPAALTADKLLGRYQDGRKAEELSISPRASWAAYHSEQNGFDNLYYLSMKTRQARALLPPPARAVRNSETWYMVADGLRTACGFWRGDLGPVGPLLQKFP